MTLRPIAIRALDPRLRLEPGQVRRALRVLDIAEHRRLLATPASVIENRGEISIAFLKADALARLHDRFLSDPSETDVITFPGEAAFGVAGEICVSAEAAARFAGKKARAFSDELTLYVVHGWLHLAGHDDLEPGKRRLMRRAEKQAMRLLQIAGAVPRFAFFPAGAKHPLT